MTFPYDSSAHKDLPGACILSLPIRSAAGRLDTAGRQVPPTVASSSHLALLGSNLATQGGSSTKGLTPTDEGGSTQDVAYRSRFVTRSISDDRLPVSRMEPEDRTDGYDLQLMQQEWGNPRNMYCGLDEINAAMLDDPDPYEPDPLNDNMKPTEADMDIPYLLFQKVQAQLATYQAVLPNLAAEAIAKHKAASKKQVPGAEGKDDSDEKWVPLSARNLGPKEQDTVKALLIRVEKLTESLMCRNAEIWRFKRHCANMHKAYNDMNEAYTARGEEQAAEIEWQNAEIKKKNAEITMLKQQLAEARGTNTTNAKEGSAQGEAMDVDEPNQSTIQRKRPCRFGDACLDKSCRKTHPRWY